jgi:hypothetical protein
MKENDKNIIRKYNLLSDSDEVNLKELQIKLEKIHGYIRKTEMRLTGHETVLTKLREKQRQVEAQRQKASVITRPKLEKKV